MPETCHINAWRVPYEEILADPETMALVAAAPQAERILRPMCRVLHVEVPAYLQLPPRPSRQRKPRPPKVKPPLDRDEVVRRMSRLEYAQLINPEVDGKPNGHRPPNRIGYGAPRRWPRPG